MFVRVVRFTGVTAEQVGNVAKRIQESDGPPPGVEAKGIKLMFDAAAGTAVVLQEFATAQAMEDGGQDLRRDGQRRHAGHAGFRGRLRAQARAVGLSRRRAGPGPGPRHPDGARSPSAPRRG